MEFRNDRHIHIATGASRKSTYWQTQIMLWSDFVAKLQTPIVTPETKKDYDALPKAKQDELKDVGGFVGGELSAPRRKATSIKGRDIITLDADNIDPGGTQAVINAVAALGCAYVIYSTRKHSSAKPRLRIIFPLDRQATVEEYEPAARKIASLIDMRIMDPTTFDVCRLMYWPSRSSDGEYVYTYSDAPWLCLDGVLKMYANWRDATSWPQTPSEGTLRQKSATKQGDPTTKHGVVGAFCRTYDIVSAIETYLPGVYTPCDDGRYTYAQGSTAGGAVLYDDGKYLYSHHATDPCSGRLVNAFDLVRLHKYGDLDADAKPDTPTVQLPSYKAMTAAALEDKAVASMLVSDRYQNAVAEFIGTPQDGGWQSGIKLSSNTGMPLKTIDNILYILEHDPQISGKFAHDEHANRPVVLESLPWPRAAGEVWSDIDDAGLRCYIEKVYGITGKDRIADAFALYAQRHSFHRIRAYLEAEEWDGNQRLDTLLIDYFGAEDTEYTRAVTRKTLVAAVARIMHPGVKFDQMLILTGAQGIGKTTLMQKLAGRWHIECGADFRGKDMAELIQGYWIVELGELKGFNRSEISDVKQFISRTEDVYREPYGRRPRPYPRQCIFVGTTNDNEYLRDKTGNRRFWPIDLGKNKAKKNIFELQEKEVHQIWAEAVVRWNKGESLYLSGEVAKTAKNHQRAHEETSPREGLILEYINKKIPADWYDRNLSNRRLYWGLENQDGTQQRDRICAAEIWCECFGANLKDMKRSDVLEINGVLSNLPGWERNNSVRFGPAYGVQRGFVRKPEMGEC